jgi:hypothetical protein
MSLRSILIAKETIVVVIAGMAVATAVYAFLSYAATFGIPMYP